MEISFKTTDELFTPPPVKEQKRRATPWWLLLLLIGCAAGVWWLSQDRSRPTESPEPGPLHPRERGRMQTEQAPPSQPKAVAPAQPSLPAARSKAEIPQPSAVAPGPSGTAVTPQPSSPMEQPAVVPPAATEQSAPQPKNKPPAPPVERPITVQLQKETDSLQMLLGVARDERNQKLRTSASSQAEIDVLVQTSVGERVVMGRARVMALDEHTVANSIVVLEFLRMPELEELVLLTNARLSRNAKLVLVFDGGLKLEYPFDLGTGTLENGR